MASEIKVNTIKDLGGNTIVSSNGSGTITGLPASAISSGTVATARLGSGTASSSTFLAGDSSYKTVSGTTINNNADNRVITGSGTANTLEGEANLTYNGTFLGVGASADLGVGVHIKTADSGASVESHADELVVEGSGNTGMTILAGTGSASIINFGDSGANNVGMLSYDHAGNYMRMKTNGSDRMRILSDGTITMSTSGSIPSNQAGLHVNRGDGQNGGIIRGHSESTSYDSTLLMLTCARDAEGNEFNFFIGKNNNSDDKIIIRNDGDIQNVNNSYGAISDERFKQNITDASSQWNDIKALKIRNFQTKQEPTLTQLGVIAQELQASGMNGLVDEVPPTENYIQYSSDFGSIDEEGVFTEGQNIKTVKYSVLYMKSIKALQEAMEKIETLETANTNKDTKITALETANATQDTAIADLTTRLEALENA